MIVVKNAQTTNEIFDRVSELFTCHGIPPLPENKNAKLIIKPNLNSNMNTLTGNTTDLRLLSAVLHFLKKKGYKNITIAEGYAGGFHREKINVIQRLRVDLLAKVYAVNLIDANFESETFPVLFEKGLEAEVAKVFKDFDYFINIPKIKTHTETILTCCCKSLIGCLVGKENKKKVHTSLFKNIINLNKVITPTLYIVDGLISMEGNGPTTGTPKKTNIIIAGVNPYEIDLFVSKLIGINDFKKVPVLKEAFVQNIISEDMVRSVAQLALHFKSLNFLMPHLTILQKIVTNQKCQKYFQMIRHAPVIEQICTLKIIKKLMYRLKLTQEVFRRDEPIILKMSCDKSRCIKCKKCENYCPMGISPFTYEGNIVNNNDCIKCLYCYSVCPQNAITIEGSLGFYEEQEKQYSKIIKEYL